MIKNIAVAACVAVLMSCGSGNNQNGNDNVDGGDAGAVEMLASVFSGFYTTVEIQSKMDSVMIEYSIPINKDNYLRLGNELTSLRKESTKGVREMDIIDDMLRNADSSKSFTEQAGLSARSLEQKQSI